MRREQFSQMIRRIFATKADELVCTECLEHLPRVVDLQVSGRDPVARLPTVMQHLRQCPECEEVYRALLAVSASNRSAGE
jgi:hypothetical protein